MKIEIDVEQFARDIGMPLEGKKLAKVQLWIKWMQFKDYEK